MSLPQLVDDARAVIEYSLRLLGHDELILLGHSWGSFLAVHTLHQSSQGIAAYVATGQVADMVENHRDRFDFALEAARTSGNAVAMAQLQALVDDPVVGAGDRATRAVVRNWAKRFGWAKGREQDWRNRSLLMTTEEYSLFDIYRYLRGSILSMDTLGRALFEPRQQPMQISNRLPVPFYLFSGADDTFTPTDLATRYFERVQAPVKEHVIFTGSGHWPMVDEPGAYLDALVRRVREHVT